MANAPALRTPSHAVWRDLAGCALAALAIYALSNLIVANAGTATGFGAQWQRMSAAPLALHGQFPHRLLSPLLAHLLGLGGPRFPTFVHALSVCLLGTVCWVCRRRGASFPDSILVTVAVAATGAIQMYKNHWVGFPDALGFTLWLWLLQAARHGRWFWLLYAANLLQHELALFLLPWAFWLRRQAGAGRLADVAAAGVVLALYGAFYLWVRSTAAEQVYDAGYFLRYPIFPGGTVVVLGLAATHVLLAFGPLLAVLAWQQHDCKDARERGHLWLVGGAIVAIFGIAYDWSRHANLLAIPLVVAAQRFLANGHRVAFTLLTTMLVVATVLVPPWAQPPWPGSNLTSAALSTDVMVLSHRADPQLTDTVFGPLGDVLGRWLPAALPTLGPVLLLLGAWWWLGRTMARAGRHRDVASAAVDGHDNRWFRRVAIALLLLAAAAAVVVAPGDQAPAESAAARRLRNEHGPAITFVTTHAFLARHAGVRSTCITPPAAGQYTPTAMWELITRQATRVGADWFLTSRASFAGSLRELAAAAPAGATFTLADGDTLVVRLPRPSRPWLQHAHVARSADGTQFELTVQALDAPELLGVGFTVVPPAGEPALLPLTPLGGQAFRATLPVPPAAAGRWRFVPGCMLRDGVVLQAEAVEVLVP